MITKTTTGHPTLRALGLAAVAGLVLAVACETPGPTGPAEAGSNALALDEVSSEWSSGECTPTVFVDGAESSLVEVEDAIDPTGVESIHVFKPADRERPEGTESCGIIVILLKDASPDEEAASRRLIERLTAAKRAAAGQEVRPSPSVEDVQAAPTFTPMTVRPRLRNAGDMRAALEAAYPPSLREQGIGGTTNVWFLIDADGAVQRVLVNASSGHDAIDDAALEVARTMEFTPAYNREKRVPVWVALDITFETE